jgi:molybdopterin synthase sulfur carrier subunit
VGRVGEREIHPLTLLPTLPLGGIVATVHIPSLMRNLTGGQDKVSVPGKTVAQVIDALDALHPGVKARLCDGDQLARGLAVSVDGVIARLRLRTPVKADSVLRFMPVIEGG